MLSNQEFASDNNSASSSNDGRLLEKISTIESKTITTTQGAIWEEKFLIKPEIFPLYNFDNKILVHKKWGQTYIYDFEMVPPRQYKTKLDFRNVYLVFGKIAYGVNSQNQGIVYDLEHDRILSNLDNFNEPLKPENCGYVTFQQLIMCSTETKQLYKLIHLTKNINPVEQKYLAFNPKKPYTYKNETVLGCEAFAMNLQCSFYNFKDNSSAIMTIEEKTYFTPDDSPQFLVIPELDILAVSLVDKTMSFFDLSVSGDQIASYYSSQDDAFTKNYLNLAFSNHTQELVFTIDMNQIEILKFEPRYRVKGCRFFNYQIAQCMKCKEGLILSKSKQGCLSFDDKGSGPGDGKGKESYLDKKYWSIERIIEYTDLQYKIKVNFANKTREQTFYTEFDPKTQLEIVPNTNRKNNSAICEFNTEVVNMAIFVRPICIKSIKTQEFIFRLKERRKSSERKLEASEIWTQFRDNSIKKIEKASSNSTNNSNIGRIIPIPSIHKPSTMMENSLRFFKICSLAAYLSVIFFLLAFPFWASLQLSRKWSLKVLYIFQKFQFLSFFGLINVYYWQRIDKIFGRVMTQAFWWILNSESSNANINSSDLEEDKSLINYIFGSFSKWNKESHPKYWELVKMKNLSSTWSTGILLLLVIYFTLILLNFVTIICKKVTTKLSMVRTIYSNCIILPVSLFTVLILKNYIKRDLNNQLSAFVICMVLSNVVMFTDIMMSFSSPIFTNKPILRAVFPLETSSFHVYSPRIFGNLTHLQSQFKNIQKLAILEIMKFPLFLLCIGTLKHLVLAISLLIWSIFYIYWDCSLNRNMKSRRFSSNTILTFLRKLELFLVFTFSILTLYAALDSSYKLASVQMFTVVSFVILVVYILL